MIDIIITGDTFLGGGRTEDLAVKDEAEKLFGPFYEKLRKADLSITNLESPITNSNQKIPKTGPHIKSHPDSLSVLKKTGINLVTLANNHIMDFGVTGLRDTLDACQEQLINTVGAGINPDETVAPFFIGKDGLKVAIINIAENEFGTIKDDHAGANPLNIVQNFYSIQRTSEEVDYVIVIIHGGHEHYPLPSPRMKETYRFFIEAGASAVVGHHPHCFSGYEVYNNAPIFYSLGNFLFDKEKRYTNHWNEGFAVRFRVSKKV
jgi:poly-gamma-glutamate capsule biosynthesis protein CapA/YwtB (metallophosphatase superfamily)